MDVGAFSWPLPFSSKAAFYLGAPGRARLPEGAAGLKGQREQAAGHAAALRAWAAYKAGPMPGDAHQLRSSMSKSSAPCCPTLCHAALPRADSNSGLYIAEFNRPGVSDFVMMQAAQRLAGGGALPALRCATLRCLRAMPPAPCTGGSPPCSSLPSSPPSLLPCGCSGGCWASRLC